MQLEIPNPTDMDEILALVREKKEIEGKLAAVGGKEFSFLLEDCADLSDIIENIREVKSKRGEKEHAAFESKIKFSRKIRRKAKDLRNFEQKVVAEFEQKHIPLEHGRKMVAIIKLLRSQDVEKAEHEADEFYAFLDMGDRLKLIDDTLARKRAQIGRAARSLSAQLSDLEWLETQAMPDAEKIGRHERRQALRLALEHARAEYVRSLQAMPLHALLEKSRKEELGKFGFPELSPHENEALSGFLQKSRLEGKSAEELWGMAGESEQKLRHHGIDLPGFRQEIVARRAFLSKIMHLHAGDFLKNIPDGSPARDYLASHSEGAKRAREGLLSLGGNADEDEKEWKMQDHMGKKRAELAGLEKSALEHALDELQAQMDALDGKIAAGGGKAKEGKGFLESFFGLFRK